MSREVSPRMHFSLLTPEGERYAAEVDEVLAQGTEGELGILPDHIPLVTPLKVASVRVKIKGEEQRFAVYGGLLKVTPDEVVVLTERVELPEEIDRAAALAQQEELEAQLNRSRDPEEREALQRQLHAVAVQLEVVG